MICQSPNNSREVSVISTGFFMNYAECIQAQANNLFWTEQVENREVHSLSLSYATLKKVIPDTMSMGHTVESIHISHAVEIN